MPPNAPFFLSAIAFRTLIVLLILVLGLRILGKRQIGQMNIYDLALIMLLANAVQNAMTQGSGFLLTGVTSATVLFGAGWAISRLFTLSPELEKRVVGNSTLLINDGKLLRDHLKSECVTEEQVMAMMRQHGLSRLEQVQMAVLEVDGSISIVPKQKASP